MGMRQLNLAQRIILVIGLGIGLTAFGEWVTIQGSRLVAFGWVGYAPLSSAAPSPGGLNEWVRLLIWLGLTATWTATSIRILREPQA